MSIIQGTSKSAAAGGDFDTGLIPNSVFLDGSADFLKQTFGSASNQKRFVLGTWIQRNKISSGTVQNVFATGADGSNGFFFTYENATSSRDDRINIFNISGGSIDWNIQTTARFRDIAYYHILLSYESAASTSTDRVQIFINGVLQTSFEISSFPSSGFDCDWGAAQSHCIGNNDHNTAAPLPAYLTQTIYLDGKSIQNSDVAVTDFLEAFSYGTNGSQFGPKANADVAALASSAGGNSFCLNYENSILLGQDSSNNSETNIALGQTGLKSDDLQTGAASLLTDGTQFGSWNAGSGLVFQNSAVTTKSWWGVDFGADGVAVTKAVLSGNASGDASLAGFTQASISNVTFTLFGSDSAQATSNNDLSSLTTVGSVVVSNTQTKGVTATISASSNTTKFRFYYVQMNTTESTRRLLAEIQLFTVGNSFATTSMTSVNQSGNTPSLVYPVFNPLAQVGTATGTLSEGNTKVVLASDNGITATQPIPSTGLWYWEMDWTAGANGIYPGVCVQSAVGNTASSPHARTDTWIWLAGDSQGRVFNGSSLDAYVGSATAVGKIAVCFDADNTAMYFGTISTTTITWLDSGDPTSGSSKTGAAPFTSLPTDETVYIFQSTGDASTVQYLFDEDDWTGATNRPAAALALSSANLPTPEFQGADFFNTNLYTGNGTAIGSGGKAVTGVGFKPDWSWIKNRDATDSHSFYDLVRGTTKQIESDNTAVQTTEAEGLTTFGTDGFTVGNLAQVNTNTEDYVSWNWLANNATESISASGANPTLASTNTASDSGAFGMCTYTGNATAGSTVKHSLGGVPDMIMFKRFGSTTANWLVYFKELGAGNLDYLILDLKLAEGGAGAVAWLNSTAATSTLVTLGNDGNVNASDTYIMYLFRNVPGVCKVGSYTGNGNNNGPYVSVGFLPRYILVRSTSANRNWNTLDTARNPINITSPSVLLPNSTAVDTAGQVGAFDILADGFKPRDTAANTNGSGEKYTYLAMADIGGNGTLPPIYAR